MASDDGLTKLMLKVIRDMKMMPNDIMSNGKTVSRNAFEHVRSVLQHDLELNVIKTKRRHEKMKTSVVNEKDADAIRCTS
jgi:hypothetical protein